MWRRSDFVADDVTLGEGDTPLREVPASLVSPEFGGRLYVKDETRNPSGSFKDRLVAAAMTQARRLGAERVVSASSGNAGAAAACYAANAGIPALICCPESTPHGKLAQIKAYGAQLELVPGHYGNSFARAMELTRQGYANLTTTYLNPFGVDALRLFGQEIVAALGKGAAMLDRRHDLELGEAQVPCMGGPIRRPFCVEDVGDLDRGAHGSAGRRLALHQRHQAVERPGDSVDRPGRDLGVERGRLKLAVAEQDLDDADVDILFEQVGGEAVTQRVRADALADAGGLGGLAMGTVNGPVLKRYTNGYDPSTLEAA